MLGSIIALFIFACIWNDITGPIKRDNFLRKLHSLGNPYGASFDRIKATLGNPDLVETQGNFVAAQWCGTNTGLRWVSPTAAVLASFPSSRGSRRRLFDSCWCWTGRDGVRCGCYGDRSFFIITVEPGRPPAGAPAILLPRTAPHDGLATNFTFYGLCHTDFLHGNDRVPESRPNAFPVILEARRTSPQAAPVTPVVR